MEEPIKKETKEKQAKARNKFFDNGGKIHGNMKGKFKPINPSKYLGNSANIIYRSSYEFKAFRMLDSDPNVVGWSSEEFCIQYKSPKDGKVHRYFPDILVKKRLPSGIIETTVYEIKPLAFTKPPKNPSKVTKSYVNACITYAINEAKWAAAEKYCKSNGYKWMIITEVDLNIPSKDNNILL